jgi:putative sterol carrier protein
VRHRIIGRVMRALSVLYRYDLGGNLRAVMVFEVGGEGGGQWYVNVSPDSTRSAEESVPQADFRLTFRDTSTFCRMFTGRLNLIAALLTGQLRYQGDPRLLFRFGSLFSVDARK